MNLNFELKKETGDQEEQKRESLSELEKKKAPRNLTWGV